MPSRLHHTNAVSGLVVSLLGGLFLTGCAVSGGEQSEGPVELERMLSAAEFREAGLDQLDDEQLARLNALLTRELTSAEVADSAAVEAWERSDDDVYATFGLESEHPRAKARDQMTSYLVGELDGWEKGRRIRLANGQVWEVASSPSTMFGAPVSDVPVTVERAFMGTFRMLIGDKHPGVRVRRVE